MTAKFEFGGSVILVTGASSGIGRQTAIELGRLGAHVVVVARREAELCKLTKEIADLGATATAIQCDLSIATEVQALADAVLTQFDRVDVLINSAGQAIRRSVLDSYGSLEDLDRLLAVNYLGPARLITLLLPTMVAAGRGKIINVASTVGLYPVPRYAAYSASKAALCAFSDALAAESLDRNVTVTDLYFPLVRTSMSQAIEEFRNRRDRWGYMMSTERAVSVIVDAIRTHPRRVTFGGWALALFRTISPSGYARWLSALYRAFPGKSESLYPVPAEHWTSKSARRLFKRSPL